ncbi:MAG: DUF423 domain-containing protein [Phycisphaerae bacterium]|nr:MAG: DUF423 domain-containing protein [Planctomycetota bacterium]KAB2941513.1 MAG: DUF423 domain-containing protein [Phycisphaerae bacterium]MBE7458890.1 DUF423 domain-containing protein [Planctomycetia bacterium]MCK6466145.1 DUF423 domain-containing protein [Phycisphaerae bacterium]MCL4720178.1 DUF423 domain-containing protein [Phycisphaerae bacterium]
MKGTSRFWVRGAAINGLLAVAAGAFGAHALKTRLAADRLEVFETAARYQMYHALALLGVAWIAARAPSRWTTASGAAFLVGTAIFSGSLYVYALGGGRVFAMVTPVGGVALLAGWALLWSAAGRADAAGPDRGA